MGDQTGDGELRIRATRYGAGPMVLLAGVNLIDQIDQAILRAVLPLLEEEWNLSDLQLGMLGFAFVFVNVIATIPAGWLADHYRRTRLIGWTLLSWSGLSLLSATAVNYPHLFAARGALGIGHAVDDPSATSLLGDYYPARARGRAFSLQQVSLFVGSGIGLTLGGLVGAALGWRWAFILVGMPGSLIAFFVFRMREPRRGEADELDGKAPAKARKSPSEDMPMGEFMVFAFRSLVAEMKFIFSIRTMRYILVGVGSLLFTVSGIGFWLAVYHTRYSDMTLVEATAVTGVVFGIGGLLGTLIGGSLADRVHRFGPRGRINLVVAGVGACSLLFVVSFSIPNIPLRLFAQFLGVGAGALGIPALRASMMDVVPAESRGVGSSAFSLVAAVFGTALAPPLVGLLSDLTSLVGAFYIVFPPVIAGTLLLLRARTTIVADAEALITGMSRLQHEPDQQSGA
jgi:MFS family permease